MIFPLKKKIMNLFPGVAEAYTKDDLPMLESQRLAHFIAYGPMIFEAARLLVKFGLLDGINHSKEGLTVEEAAEKCGISEYAARVLLEAGLSMGAVIVNPETDRYSGPCYWQSWPASERRSG